jgi:hypothetical protein
MKWLTQRLVLILLILSALGCNSSTRSSETVSSNTALFDPTTATVPLPNILATATAGDPLTQYLNPVTGQVGLRPNTTPLTPLEALAYVNLYEVGGTHAVSGLNAPIYLRFAASLVPGSVTGANIKVFQITVDNNGQTENNPLGFTDVTGMFSFSYTAGSREVQLFPNFPLLPGTRYLYLVTDRVKDAATGASVAGSVYFNALKSPLPLVGPFADLEQIRANRVAGGNVVLSGYAKVMDDLIAAPAVSTVTSRSQIALLGRFITTAAGFVATDAAGTTRIPVESALHAFATGAFGQAWVNTATMAKVDPATYWAALAAGSAPNSVAAVVTGSFPVADISTNAVATLGAAAADLGVPAQAYPPSTYVTRPFRSGGNLAGYYHNGTRSIPFVYFAPTTPAAGAPDAQRRLVIFQHGITGRKEQAAAVVGSLTAAGFSVIAIDLPLHGALAFSGHESDSTLWGQDFMALGAPLAARSNIQQAAFNLFRLETVVKDPAFATGLAGLSVPAPSSAQPRYLSLSLGSIVGAYYLAGNIVQQIQPQYDAEMKGLLSVPGGRIAYLLKDSATFGPSIEQGLRASGVLPGTPEYSQFFLLTQAILDPVDPATMTTPLAPQLPSRLSGRLLVQEATSTQFDAAGVPANGDRVIPNASTRYFGNALGGRGVLGHDVAAGFKQLAYHDGSIPFLFLFSLNNGGVVPKTGSAATAATATEPLEGYFQFDPAHTPDATHGFLIDQPHSPVSIQLVQRQMVYYLLTGLVVDPTVTSGALPKTLLRGAAGIDGQVTVPPVMQIFGQP